MKLRRGDKDGTIVLLIIIVLCVCLFPYINNIFSSDDSESKVSSLLKREYFAKKNAREDANGSSRDRYYAVPEEQSELFRFDPNTADSTQLLRLGLRPWQVRNIYKYRAAGGRYRKPSDFARLYGLTAAQYERLLPYISIKPERMAADVYGEPASADDYQQHYDGNGGYKDAAAKAESTVKPNSATTYSKPDTTLFPRKITAGQHININTADTTQLKRIPGIGSYYAKRIVQHRERLGGLYSPTQLREIENFPESSLQYMTVGERQQSTALPAGVRRIRINNLNARDLSRHPYIRYAQAKQIEERRRMKGNFTSAGELGALPSFNQQEITRLAPYLDFE